MPTHHHNRRAVHDRGHLDHGGDIIDNDPAPRREHHHHFPDHYLTTTDGLLNDFAAIVHLAAFYDRPDAVYQRPAVVHHDLAACYDDRCADDDCAWRQHDDNPPSILFDYTPDYLPADPHDVGAE